jgi:phosphomevalonate kinase
MIAGEYVVLDGEEALVAAVSSRATARWTSTTDGSPRDSGGSPGAPTLPPEVVLTLEHALRSFGPVPMQIDIDTSPLRHGDRKLGLGSSAAAAVAAAGAVVAFHDGDLERERRRILGWALAGHRAIAPQGSGADVAASALGGIVCFKSDAVEDAQSIVWPADLSLEVVWTGAPARTSDLVAKVRVLADVDRTRYELVASPLRAAASELIAAIAAGDARAAASAADAHGRAVGRLGEAAGASIMTPSLERAASLARQFDGGAKPSGAGGGDVAIALFADPDRAAAFRDACPAHDLTPLSLSIGAEGVRAEGA